MVRESHHVFSWTTFKFTGRSYVHELTQANLIVHLVASFWIFCPFENLSSLFGLAVLKLLFRPCYLAFFFLFNNTYYLTWSFYTRILRWMKSSGTVANKNKSIFPSFPNNSLILLNHAFERLRRLTVGSNLHILNSLQDLTFKL